ncbi:rhodanese-like domain-containing protein [Parabacteroides pacaensis]|uniref:rhodanese-like domain-containing protein n=1 Tax=Parabacteroides pacaensis TaxID=2086575 RepID=UPI000D0E4142|nr:rhodanese-like domain-containing protein [Parabacteroides pacaensis]
MKATFFCLLVLLLVTCKVRQVEPKQSFTSYSVAGFDSILHREKVQLVDVRTEPEYKEKAMRGAVNIDVKDSTFINKADSLLDKTIPVAVYCKGGIRSKKAAEKLSVRGYKVYNLAEGFDAWLKEGMPVK